MVRAASNLSLVKKKMNQAKPALCNPERNYRIKLEPSQAKREKTDINFLSLLHLQTFLVHFSTPPGEGY